MSAPSEGHGHCHGDDGEPVDQASWDERYRGESRLWSGRPNASVVAVVEGITPGRALDVGCGEGADAMWLASQGWEVLGVDISSVALERARELAEQLPPPLGDRLTWQRVDLPQWSPPEEEFDLVTAAFLHLPSAWRPEVWRTLASAVRPGGHLVVVAHDASDPHVAERLLELGDRFFGADEVISALPGGWEVDSAGVRERPPAGERRDGHVDAAVDLVVHAVRRCA